MPNKYSHAFVLNNYEAHGLIDYKRPLTAESIAPSRPLTKSSTNPKPYNTGCSTSSKHSSGSKPPERLRLGSPTRSKPEPVPYILHRKSSSVETQIYAPLSLCTPSSKRDSTNTVDLDIGQEAQDEGLIHEQSLGEDRRYSFAASTNWPKRSSSPPPRNYPPRIIAEQNRKHTTQKQQHHAPHTTTSNAKPGRPHSSAGTTARHDHVSQHHPRADPATPVHITKQSQAYKEGQQSNATLIRPCSSAGATGRHDHYSQHHLRADPTTPVNVPKQSQAHNKGQQPLNIPNQRYLSFSSDAQKNAFAPYGPPSPPATPESPRSFMSFSLGNSNQKPDNTRMPPPIPERDARRTSPKSSAPHLPTASLPTSQPERQRPKTSSATKSPTSSTFPVFTRTSSLVATTLPPSDLNMSAQSSKKSTMYEIGFGHRPSTSATISEPFSVADEDLESLPETFDSSVLPWTDDDMSPAIFRDGELNSRRPSYARPPSTRATSFDSASPPPISLNRRMPDLLREAPPSISMTPRTPKKNQSSMASLMFFRSGPKAILYSETRPATPPIPVSVSRTAVPSIPALFPGYKGQFPPENKEERTGRTQRNVGTDVKSRTRSVPPKSSSSGKRRSWFKNDQLDAAFGTAIRTRGRTASVSSKAGTGTSGGWQKEKALHPEK